MAAKKESSSKKNSSALPATPEEKKKALETALVMLDKVYGKGIVMKMGEKPKMNPVSPDQDPDGFENIHYVYEPVRAVRVG